MESRNRVRNIQLLNKGGDTLWLAAFPRANRIGISHQSQSHCP